MNYNYKGKKKKIIQNKGNTEKSNNKKKSIKKTMNNKEGKKNGWGGTLKTKASCQTSKKIILENDKNGKEKVNK